MMSDYTNDFVNEQMGESNLDFTPFTKQLLLDYVGNKYQEDADFSNESLKREWWYLYENNVLHELFTSEWIYSPQRHEYDAEMAKKRHF